VKGEIPLYEKSSCADVATGAAVVCADGLCDGDSVVSCSGDSDGEGICMKTQ
jgi:hypothetical protein